MSMPMEVRQYKPTYLSLPTSKLVANSISGNSCRIGLNFSLLGTLGLGAKGTVLIYAFTAKEGFHFTSSLA